VGVRDKGYNRFWASVVVALVVRWSNNGPRGECLESLCAHHAFDALTFIAGKKGHLLLIQFIPSMEGSLTTSASIIEAGLNNLVVLVNVGGP
jgi:hypothetical protein